MSVLIPWPHYTVYLLKSFCMRKDKSLIILTLSLTCFHMPKALGIIQKMKIKLNAIYHIKIFQF